MSDTAKRALHVAEDAVRGYARRDEPKTIEQRIASFRRQLAGNLATMVMLAGINAPRTASAMMRLLMLSRRGTRIRPVIWDKACTATLLRATE